MWRRVPCEQPLHTGQSILSPRRNPMLMDSGMSRRELRVPRPSGERESGSYSGTRLRNRTHDPRIDTVT